MPGGRRAQSDDHRSDGVATHCWKCKYSWPTDAKNLSISSDVVMLSRASELIASLATKGLLPSSLLILAGVSRGSTLKDAMNPDFLVMPMRRFSSLFALITPSRVSLSGECASMCSNLARNGSCPGFGFGKGGITGRAKPIGLGLIAGYVNTGDDSRFTRITATTTARVIRTVNWKIFNTRRRDGRLGTRSTFLAFLDTFSSFNEKDGPIAVFLLYSNN
ncbi:MAG: hypothetical protein AAB483_00295 [Patescibacteria group bacterium]